MQTVTYNYFYNKELREKQFSLNEIETIIREGKYAKQCGNIAGMINSNINLGDITLEETGKLPVVRFSITENRAYTGLILLSFKYDYEAQLDAIRKTANMLPQTLMSFKGSSDKFFKVIIYFTLSDGTLSNQKEKIEGKKEKAPKEKEKIAGQREKNWMKRKKLGKEEKKQLRKRKPTVWTGHR